MSDVNIQIGTQGDTSGLSKIKDEYNLLGKAKQAYLNMREKPQAAGARMSADRKMAELERKAGDIDRRMMAAKLGIAEGTLEPKAGRESLKELKTELLRVDYERSSAREQQQLIAQRRQERMGMMAPVARAGRFAAGRTLRYGGMIGGMLGAYSLISNIMGETGGVDERNLAYATALSAARGRRPQPDYEGVIPRERQQLYDTAQNYVIDYGEKKPFFEVQEMIKKLGQTAFMTSKEMIPLLGVTKELGDFSKEATIPLVDVANISKSLGVETGVIAEFFKGALERGNISAEKGRLRGSDVEMAKMMMFNQNMMHRASESLQAMQQVMTATTHGVTGLGGFGIFNLLDTLNTSQNRAYWGAGGARAALRIDQAFTGGGTDETFQYMQTLALNPAFQATNRRRLAAAEGVTPLKTNWESGYYDQLIADLSKSLGAFSTPKDIIKTMRGMGVTGGEAYIEKMFGGDGGMEKMNIQRLFDVYKTAYGAEQGGGRKFFMQMQMARNMGVSPADIGVIGEAIADPDFMARAEKGKLRTDEYAKAYKEYKESGKQMPALDKWIRERTKNQETIIKVAQDIRTTIDNLKKVVQPLLESIGVFTSYLPGIAEYIGKIMDFWLGADEEQEKGKLIKVPSPLGEMLIPKTAKNRDIIDAMADVWPKIGDLREQYNMVDKAFEALATSMYPSILKETTSPLVTGQGVKELFDKITNFFSEMKAVQLSPEAKADIVEALKEGLQGGFKGVTIESPPAPGSISIK